MLDAAARASDDSFTAAILERWLSCGAAGSDRAALYGRLADLRQRLGDEEAEARIVARAVHEGVEFPGIDAHLDRLAETAQHARRSSLAPAGTSRAPRAAGDDAASIAWAWRELGARSWDLVGRSRSARSRHGSSPRAPPDPHGYTTFTLDLVAFSEPRFAFEWLQRRDRRRAGRPHGGRGSPSTWPARRSPSPSSATHSTSPRAASRAVRPAPTRSRWRSARRRSRPTRRRSRGSTRSSRGARSVASGVARRTTGARGCSSAGASMGSRSSTRRRPSTPCPPRVRASSSSRARPSGPAIARRPCRPSNRSPSSPSVPKCARRGCSAQRASRARAKRARVARWTCSFVPRSRRRPSP